MLRTRSSILCAIWFVAFLAGAFGLLTAPVAAQPATPETVSYPAPEEQAYGTVLVSRYICDGLDSVVWGGTPDANCTTTIGAYAFYPITDGGLSVSLELDLSGSGVVLLPVGSYQIHEVTAGGSWPGLTVQVLAEQTTVVTVLHPSGASLVVEESEMPEPPVLATGIVEVTNYFCPGVESVSLDAGRIHAGCYLGNVDLAFYLFGDGSDEYWSLSLGEDGSGSIELIAGTYAVVDQLTYTEHQLEVPAGQTVQLTIVHPGIPQPSLQPEMGYVEIAGYACPDTLDASFNVLGVAGECSPANATVRFRQVGNGTQDEWSLTVSDEGPATIELATGVYEVVEVETSASTVVTVESGMSVTLSFVRPAILEIPDGEVIVVVLSCSSVGEMGSSSSIGNQTEPTSINGCTPSSTNLTFSTADIGSDKMGIRMYVDSAATMKLKPGGYNVVDEETQVLYQLKVLPGQLTFLVVSQPASDDVGTVNEHKAPMVDRRIPE